LTGNAHSADVVSRPGQKLACSLKPPYQDRPHMRQGPKGPANVGSMTAAEVERIIIGAMSLATATAKQSQAIMHEDGQAAKTVAASVAAGLREAQQVIDASGDDWRKEILWVDDRPDNNVYERRAFEPLGITFTLATSTDQALELLSTQIRRNPFRTQAGSRGTRRSREYKRRLRAV
ncbi:MAG: hypothetical protein ACJ74Z_20105, partial [Bryobacteraceae bacterium]